MFLGVASFVLLYFGHQILIGPALFSCHLVVKVSKISPGNFEIMKNMLRGHNEIYVNIYIYIYIAIGLFNGPTTIAGPFLDLPDSFYKT